MEISYSNNNVENYGEYLIANGLKIGDKIRKNYGSFKASNQIFEVVEINDNVIVAKCCEVIKPTISQERRLKKLLSEEIIIVIDKCGSFPEYIKF